MSYAAEIRRPAQRGNFDVTVESIDGKPTADSRLVVKIERVPDGVHLLGAGLTTLDDAPCGDAVWAEQLGREDRRRPDAALIPGERISFAFPGRAIALLADEPARLELFVQTEQGNRRCIPLPLVAADEDIELEAVQRFTLGFDATLESFTSSLGSVSQVVTAPLVVGVWLDAWHLHAGGGVAGAGCPDTRCPIDDADDDVHIDYSNSYLVLGGVGTALWEAGEIGVGATLRYRVMYLTADTFAGQDSEQFWMHGPVLSPSFMVVMPVVKPREVGGAREALIALEIPIGYAITSGRSSSPSIGAALRFQLTVF